MEKFVDYFSPLAVNYKRLDMYNPELELDTILVFEKITLIAINSRTRVFRATTLQLEKSLRLGRRRVEKSLDYLMELGIIVRVGTKKHAASLYRYDPYALIRQVSKFYDYQQEPDVVIRRQMRNQTKAYLYKSFKITGVSYKKQPIEEFEECEY